MLEILKERLGYIRSEWVFPGPSGDRPLRDPKRAWKLFRDRTGLADFKIHDLRRTFGSWMAANGVSLVVIGKSLGHRSLQATQVYSRLELTPVKDAVQIATKAMLLAANPKRNKRKEGKGSAKK